MNNTDGYSTPTTFPTNEDFPPHGPLSPPSTPRYRKPTIGVKRMPSHLALPTLEDLDVEEDMMNPANDHDLPSNIYSLKPRTDLPMTLSYRASFISPTTNVVLVEAVVATRSNKRQRKHHNPSRCSIRTSLSPINSSVQTPRKSSRSDSCDW